MKPITATTAMTNTRELSRPMWYMASPYSHPDTAVREARFRAVAHVAAHYIRQGISVFCPITHSHPIEVEGFEGGPFAYPTAGPAFWRDFDRPMMEACCGCITATLPGWEKSKGVAGEEDFFHALGRPVMRDHSWLTIVPSALTTQLFRVPALEKVQPGEVIYLPDGTTPEDYQAYTGNFDPAD